MKRLLLALLLFVAAVIAADQLTTPKAIAQSQITFKRFGVGSLYLMNGRSARLITVGRDTLVAVPPGDVAGPLPEGAMLVVPDVKK